MTTARPKTPVVPAQSFAESETPVLNTPPVPSVAEHLAAAYHRLAWLRREHRFATSQLNASGPWREPRHKRWYRKLAGDLWFDIRSVEGHIAWLEAGCPEPVEPVFVPADE